MLTATVMTASNAAFPISELSGKSVTLDFTATDSCGKTATGKFTLKVVNEVRQC